MARKNPVPQREQEIGRRLRQFREAKKLSRVAFAREVGLDSTTFANYEFGRVPLPYEVAKRIGFKLNLNPVWLAEGFGPLEVYVELHPSLENKIAPRSLFSAAYDQVLKKTVGRFQRMKAAAALAQIKLVSASPAGMPMGEENIWYLKRTVEEEMQQIPKPLQIEFCRAVGSAVEAFKKKHKKELASFQAAKAHPPKDKS